MTTWQNVRALYQIYPRSFRDTNGDGIGDINGIIEKLPYLKGKDDSLGIDALWISPFYPSPMRDFGYDVSDYRGVHQMFGNLDDFERLIDVAHAADIKIMIDFVPNHTSDEHEWFVSSRSGKESVHRDWYVWRDPSPAGGPPNNWLSVFGGSAWRCDEASGQYYLHSFLAEQPDLNWENPHVRAAMNDVLRFWLDKGVDGFRCDAVRWIAKDEQLRDDPVNPDYSTETHSDPYHALLHTHSRYGKKLFEYLGELSETTASYEDRLIIFEDYPDAGPERMEQYMDFYRNIDVPIAAPINYDMIHEPYSATEIRRGISNFQAALRPEDLPIYGFGNHDNSRLASNRGAVPEVIVDGKTGFIVDNSAEMILSIAKLNKIKRKDCRDHVEKNFSKERMVDNYAAVFEEIVRISGKKKPSRAAANRQRIQSGINKISRRISTNIRNKRS